MSDLATLYERNRVFAESFDQGELPIQPGLSSVILTCMDSRVDPAHYAGLRLGEAFVLRNAGARVTEAVGRELAMVWELLSMAGGTAPSLELVIVQHTACGMARFADPEVAQRMTDRFGSSDIVSSYAIADSRLALQEDVQRLRDNPVVPSELRVSAHLYDVGTGRLEEVVPTRTLG